MIVTARAFANAFVTVALSACASRTFPSSFPATSAASSAAAEGQPWPVTRALREDPPLPGEAAKEWIGLRSGSDSQSAPMGGHHEHNQQAPASENHGNPVMVHGARDGAKPSPEEGSPAKATYACPMHPDVVSDHEGRCPRCGMALERRP